MPLTRILIATDFSEASLAAARWVSSAVSPGATVILTHAVDVPAPPGFLRSLFTSVDTIVENAVPGARTRLEALRQELGLPDAVLDVRTGKAFKALQDASAEHRPHLLVIGPHGDRTGLGRLLGSTAERAIREIEIPVLITQGSERGRPKRLLVAVDDTPGGRRALRFAADLARGLEAELVAVNVVDALLAGAVGVGGAPREREKAIAELRQASEAWLREQTADLGLPAGPLTLQVRTGHPADEVVTAAREVGADILIIGRNTSGMAMTNSSIADLVIRAHTMATVVVPA